MELGLSGSRANVEFAGASSIGDVEVAKVDTGCDVGMALGGGGPPGALPAYQPPAQVERGSCHPVGREQGHPFRASRTGFHPRCGRAQEH